MAMRATAVLLSGLVKYVVLPPAASHLASAAADALLSPCWANSAARAFSKVPWKLNHTRKANVRERVAGVRDVLRVLRETTPIKALVRYGGAGGLPTRATQF